METQPRCEVHPLLLSRGKKKRKGKVCVCSYDKCNKEFYQPQSNLGKYCSRRCRGLACRSTITIICKTCRRPYETYISQLQWRGSGYCSNRCKWDSYKLKRGASSPSWKGGFSAKYDQIERRRPKYVEWRKSVFTRDRYKCQIPNCQTTDHYVEPHHIKSWRDNPELRFEAPNGITLCRPHHYVTRKNEELFESYFFDLLSGKAVANTPAEILAAKPSPPKPLKPPKPRHRKGLKAKLSWKDVEDMRVRHNSGETNANISISYRVDRSTISRIVNNARRTKETFIALPAPICATQSCQTPPASSASPATSA